MAIKPPFGPNIVLPTVNKPVGIKTPALGIKKDKPDKPPPEPHKPGGTGTKK